MTTITSFASGNWSVGATWVGGVSPGAGDNAVIAATHVVKFDRNDAATTCLTVDISGTLIPDITVNTQIVIGNAATGGNLLTVQTTGKLLWGSTTYSGTVGAVPSTVVANLCFSPQSSDQDVLKVNGVGVVEFCGDAAYHTVTKSITIPWDGSTMNCGKYFALTTGTYAAGASSIVIDTDLGFQTGDKLCIGQSDTSSSDQNRYELHEVSSYNSGTKTITLVGALAHARTLAGAYVLHLTRNVKVYSLDSTKRIGFDFTTSTGSTLPVRPKWRFVALEGVRIIHGGNQDSSPIAGLEAIGTSLYSVNSSQYEGYTFIRYPKFAETCMYRTNYSWCRGVPDGVVNCLNTYIVGDRRATEFTSWLADGVWMAGACGLPGSQSKASTLRNVNMMHGSFPMSYCDFCTIENLSVRYSERLCDNCTRITFTNPTVSVAGSMGDFFFSSNRDLRIIGGTNIPAALIPSYILNNYSEPYLAAVTREAADTNGSVMTQTCGTTTLYTSGTVPDTGVYPPPSGAAYLSRLVTSSNIDSKAVVFNFRVTLSAGQPYSFVISVMMRGTGTLPTASQLYLAGQFPGSSTLVTSVQTLSALDTWTPLSITGSAVTSGPLQVSLVVKKHQSSASYYIDFPINVSSSGYLWVQGQPNEDYVPFGSGLAYDVASEVWNRQTSGLSTAGTTGKKLGDIPLSTYVVTDADADKIADHTLRRSTANIEVSSDGDPVDTRSLYGMVAQGVHNTYENAAGTVLTITKSDDTTVLGTRTITTNENAKPITGLNTN